MTRRAAAVLLALVALVALVAPVRAAGAQASQLRIVHVTPSEGGGTSLVVAVPRELSGATLPPSAFTVTAGSTTVPTSAQRLPVDQLDVALVIDNSTSAATQEDFLRYKAAAVEFVLALPDGVGVAIASTAPPNTTFATATDHAAAVRALAAIGHQDSGDLGTAITAALSAMTQPGRRKAVVVAAPSAVSARAVASEVRDPLASAGAALHVVGSPGELRDIAAATGGLAVDANTSTALRAFDIVVADLRGQYRLDLPPLDPGITGVDATVAAEGVQASAKAALPSVTPPTTAPPPPTTAPSPPTTAPGTTSPSGGDDHTVAIVIAALVVAVLAVATATLLFVLSRRRQVRRDVAPEPRGTVTRAAPVVIDLRDETSPSRSLTAFVDPEAITALASVARAEIATSAPDALAAVVRGTPILLVDPTQPDATTLLRAVRQRADNGWSDVAVLAVVPVGQELDPELAPFVEAVVTEPIDPVQFETALHTTRVRSASR